VIQQNGKNSGKLNGNETHTRLEIIEILLDYFFLWGWGGESIPFGIQFFHTNISHSFQRNP
jgi:hypothetical protein